ncbi:MAG: hypothetical protein LDL12_04755 [Anaerolinea sp.]|nr:hypothetical protein [Anaerolinea sp.]
MNALRRVFFVCLLLVLLGAGVRLGVAQQTADAVYFPETGHWVRGPFLVLYQSADDPLLLFGYPITSEYTDPLSGQTMQYFQKARFDLAKDGQSAQIAPLGQLLYDANAPLAPVANDGAACRVFATTGYSVCYAFLQFYDAHNGAIFLGDPISAVEIREGRYVQYFRQARLEWQPEQPTGQRVVVTDLGRIYFDTVVGNSQLARPVPPDNIIAELLEPRARAFVANSLLPANSRQTVYVIVQDPYLRPIANATVSVNISLPDGRMQTYRLPNTNKDGITQLSFEVGALQPKQVIQIRAEVNSAGKQTIAQTWFRIWW